MYKKTTLWLTLFMLSLPMLTNAQFTRWQQEANYTMEIDMQEEEHEYDGYQMVEYINHSPDTLHQIFYHLYFNAFQPESMMDTRSRSILDPDGRVRDRIYYLNEDEIGYHDVESLSIDGEAIDFNIVGTLLEANLPKAIMPGDTVRFEMEYHTQVPLQIRRSGRDNAEGIDFSMTQWYPKVAEYDYRGWHTSPYVGREFYGVFGTFDVKITMDSDYTIGGSGVLQNADEIGHGYSDANPTADRLTWHFVAENVHTFAWAADPDFTHYKTKADDGTDIHIIYQEENNPSVKYWEQLGDYTARAIDFIGERQGAYPWPQFTVVQGGDGGMEYPMATLITGHRSLGSLVGVTVHELAHMWYYGALATNEAYYPWMDEGFTVFTSGETMNHLFNRNNNPHMGSYYSYLYLKDLGLEEALDTHADRYETNLAYGVGSYSKGAVFVNQLGYVVGRDNLMNGLRSYYNNWKFKHPNQFDFIREVEKVSNLELDWYVKDWTTTTKAIDYAIDDVEFTENGNVEIMLRREGDHLMPVDLFVTYPDGSQQVHHIPMRLMRGHKPNEYANIEYIVHDDWRWVDPAYTLILENPDMKPEEIEIDASLRMADVNRLNNTWPAPWTAEFFEPTQPSWRTYSYSYRPAVWYGEEAGLRLGFDSYGNYLFGQNRLDLSLWLTSGTFDEYEATNTDVDYELTYRHKLDQFGLEAYVIPSVRRYYGINEESITFEKLIGEYGKRTPGPRTLTFSLFHQAKIGSQRNVSALENSWQDGDVLGMRLGYEIGDAESNGISLFAQAASVRNTWSASYATVSGNKTYSWADDLIDTRFGFSLGKASSRLPSQYSFTVSGASPESAWRNSTYWSFANIDQGLINDLNLYTNSGSGLLGYGMAGIGSPDQNVMNGEVVNNYFSLTIWNTFKPFSGSFTKPFALELFAGTGQAWAGDYFSNFPLADDNAPQDFLLASMGAGATYDISSIPGLSDYTAQSSFLRDLKLSVRMPFYMHGLQGEDDFGTWFIFGVSDNF